MSEAIYHKVQLGRQSVVGTAVAATTVLPVDAGFLGFELNRATESPDEDYGGASRERPGRASHGVRGATATLPLVMRFQDWMHALEMHAAGSVTPTDADPVYTYVYTMDETSDTLKPYTVEYGDINSTQDEWRGVGVIATTLEMGFDALSAPGNAMWRASLGLVALDRDANAMTAAQSAPATLETMEGHLSLFSYGSTSTAFASLTELAASLKSFSLNSDIGAVARAYGGTTDIATGFGRSQKSGATFSALVKISATSKTNTLDIFDVAGALASEQRFRVTIDGSGDNVSYIDFRGRYTAVNLGDHEGEHLYSLEGHTVYDSTLGGHWRQTIINNIASVP